MKQETYEYRVKKTGEIGTLFDRTDKTITLRYYVGTWPFPILNTFKKNEVEMVSGYYINSEFDEEPLF